MPRDTQRLKVYVWEDTHVRSHLSGAVHQLSLQECERLVQWAAYCEPPDFKLVRKLASLRKQELEAWNHYKHIQQQRQDVERQLKQQ